MDPTPAPSPALQYPHNDQTSYWFLGTATPEQAKALSPGLRATPEEVKNAFTVLGAFLSQEEAQEAFAEYVTKCRVEGRTVFIFQRWCGLKDHFVVGVNGKPWLSVMALRSR